MKNKFKESTMEFKYKDVIYKGVVSDTCSGCAFEYKADCRNVNSASLSQTGFKCSDDDLIFLEKKQFQPKVNEQIIHCNKKYMPDVYCTTWVLTESDKGQKYVDVQYSACHPDDQYNKKLGIQLAKSKPKATVLKCELPAYFKILDVSSNRFYESPNIYQIYQAIVHLIK